GASDLVQETFLEAQQDFGRFRGDSEDELLAWLRALLRNRMANFTRHYRQTQRRGVSREVALDADPSREPGGGLAGDEPTPSANVAADELALAVERILAGFPEDYRRVIMLRYQQQHSFEEIGRLMGRSPDAARMLWWRAVERLEQELNSRP